MSHLPYTSKYSKRMIISCALLLFLAPLSGMFSLFAPAASSQGVSTEQDMGNVFRKHEVIELNPAHTKKQVRDTGRITLSTSERVFNLELTPYDMRAPTYQAEETEGDGTRLPLERHPVHTFKGRELGSENSSARFTIDENRVEGVIITPEGRYYLEPLKRYSPSAGKTNLVFYEEADVIQGLPGVCGVTLNERIDWAAKGIGAEAGRASAFTGVDDGTLSDATSFKEIELATEADYEFVTALGGATNANGEILGIMNQVEGIYEAELGITFRVIYQNAWTGPNESYNSTSASTLLTQFRNYWNANRPEVQRDLAHMWTGKNLDGSTVGTAYLGVVCGSPSFSYGLTQRLTSAPAKFAVTAHEIAHNFNATHTDSQPSCGDTIMQTSGSGSTQLTFCPYSRNEVISYASSNPSCLGAVTTTSPSPSLVWQNQASGSIGKWLMNGTSLIQSIFYIPGQVSDTSWKIVGTGDFNSDGKADLVWQRQADGQIGAWLMDGQVSVATQFFTPNQVSNTNWKIVGAADFNSDGRADLVWQHQTSGEIGVWLMNGTSLIQSPLFTPNQVSDTNWKIVGTGDFNSDGRADLVWQHQTTGQIGAWLMNGTTLLQSQFFTPSVVSDTNWKIVGVGDFNNDAKPDLVWQNRANGVIGVWLMNGTTMTEAPLFTPNQVSDTNWRIAGVQ